MEQKRVSGFWILISIGFLLNILFLLGQTMAIIDYDFAVSLGLQETVDEVTAVGVALNKGFGFADTVFYIPLFLIGLIGTLKRKTFGKYTLVGALAITVYWPIVNLSTLFFAKGISGFHFTDFVSFSILLSLIILYGLWGIYFLIYKSK